MHLSTCRLLATVVVLLVNLFCNNILQLSLDLTTDLHGIYNSRLAFTQ
jgi:hypothetical protein